MDSISVALYGLVSLLLFTSFVKVLTSLSIIKVGIGIEGAGFGLVMIALALALTMVSLSPQIQEHGGLSKFLTQNASSFNVESTFGSFIDKNTDPEIKARFSAFVKKSEAPAAAVEAEVGEGEVLADSQKDLMPFEVRAAAFLVSELQLAFELGFMLLVPLVLIDILVANVFVLLGITQLSHVVISLPLKLLLFVAIDGWTLLSEKLLGAYF